TSPVAPGDLNGSPTCSLTTADTRPGNDGTHTHHLLGSDRWGGGACHTHTNHFAVSDRWGDVVSYTNTIEQLGGSGIVVPGRGFLLNNELTDYNFTPTQGTAPDANLPDAGKRPRARLRRTS